ncbi:hypothetical protein [Nocardioides mesophilus]|uniref:Nuclear transport factor 2 family protein n=1 Tax=Nocardioides mesophilus TaxID=433659 RepID=A0A7G9RAB7_9ACTN|nr:hypothetical protein [Nocardioides mesophilus]QNN52542.1 hypothetical protein H9L09_19105 [Nocardioides mesophilus]
MKGTRTRRRLTAVVAAAGLLGALVLVWAAPRGQVAVPGPDATPEQVVAAYLEAVDVRDFDTANAIDDRDGSTLGRFSRPMQAHRVRMKETETHGASAHVLFTADFEGGDGTVEDGLWGYYLHRAGDGLWHITDAGVA